MVRVDVFGKWGWPEKVGSPTPKRIRLEDVMLGAEDDRLSGLWLKPEDGEVRWGGKQDGPFSEDDRLQPLVVAEVGEGGWGKRVYMHMVPATKASAWGIAGMTHLVAQKKSGSWRARTLHKDELRLIFESDRVKLEFAEDPDEALSEMGNAGPVRMVQPYADGLAKWLKPPSAFVPTSMAQLVPTEAVEAIRGAMSMMASDFKIKVRNK